MADLAARQVSAQRIEVDMFFATLVMRAFCSTVLVGCAALGVAILKQHVFKKGH